jgi:hypothetical protein
MVKGWWLDEIVWGSWVHSLVRSAPRAFFRTDRNSRRRRAQGLSSAVASCRSTRGPWPDWPEHGGTLDRSGVRGIWTARCADLIISGELLAACRNTVIVMGPGLVEDGVRATRRRRNRIARPGKHLGSCSVDRQEQPRLKKGAPRCRKIYGLGPLRMASCQAVKASSGQGAGGDPFDARPSMTRRLAGARPDHSIAAFAAFGELLVVCLEGAIFLRRRVHLTPSDISGHRMELEDLVLSDGHEITGKD